MITGKYRSIARLPFFILFALLSACGGTGGSGGTISGSFDPATATSVPVYPRAMTAGVPFTVTMIGLTGDPLLFVYDADPNTTTPGLYGFSWNTYFGSSSINTVSFIAPASGTAYPTVVSSVASTFTVTITDNQLTVDGPVKTGTTYSDPVYYSFDAVAGESYRVNLRPTSGNVNITAVSPNTDMSASVGSSSNTGTQTDTVIFTAAATQRYYIKVGGTPVDSEFEVSVLTVPVEADLSIDIDSAVSDGSNVLINYTITNNGVTGYTGDIQVDGWSAAGSAPTVGMTGDANNTHTGATVSGLGGTLSGSVSITDSSASGTAYAVVDTIDAITESDETNNVSTGSAWIAPLVAPITYDFETNVVPVSMTMSGNANWATDTSTGAGGGSYSLKAGTISHNQTSCTSLTVTGATGVAFDYAVSSETSYDFLRFYIDGSQQASWSGTVAWANASYAVTSGPHLYTWCYTKDISLDGGSDTAWVDNIVIN